MVRIAVRLTIAAVLLAATAATVAACGATNHAHTTRTTTTTTAASTNYGLAALSLMFPRDGQDIEAGAALEDFEIGVAAKSETRCLSAVDLPGPPTRPLPPLQYGMSNLPNMPLIQRTKSLGLTTIIAAPTDPGAKLPAAERKAYTVQLARCTAKAVSPFHVLHSSTAEGLSSEWANIVNETEAGHVVQLANAKATACSKRTAFPANSIENEVAAIGAKLPPLVESGREAKANATQAAGTRVLLKCYGAEVALVTKLLTARRQTFFQNNAQAIQALQNDTDKAVATLYKAGDEPGTAARDSST